MLACTPGHARQPLPDVIPRPLFGRGICLWVLSGVDGGNEKQVPRFARDDTHQRMSSRGRSLAEGSACRVGLGDDMARAKQIPRCPSLPLRTGARDDNPTGCHPEADLWPRDLLVGLASEPTGQGQSRSLAAPGLSDPAGCHPESGLTQSDSRPRGRLSHSFQFQQILTPQAGLLRRPTRLPPPPVRTGGRRPPGPAA